MSGQDGRVRSLVHVNCNRPTAEDTIEIRKCVVTERKRRKKNKVNNAKCGEMWQVKRHLKALIMIVMMTKLYGGLYKACGDYN